MKTIQILTDDHERLKVFMKTMESITTGEYIKWLKTNSKQRFTLNFDHKTGLNSKLEVPKNRDAIISCATQLRPLLLGGESIHYSKLRKALEDIADQENPSEKEKHLEILESAIVIIENVNQDKDFQLFIYGDFIKKDLGKHREISSYDRTSHDMLLFKFHLKLADLIQGAVELGRLYNFYTRTYNITSRPIPPTPHRRSISF